MIKCIFLTMKSIYEEGQVLYTVSTWKSLVSGATTYTIFFGKISSQLSPLYFLGTENHRHQLNYKKSFQCGTP